MATTHCSRMHYPLGCDTFVVLPPLTVHGGVVFGKNSDRPQGEVQEVILVPAVDHADGTQLECTYVSVEQVSHTHAVILSKPAWMWGAEMGANEHGVCIGNEAVWTRLNGPEDEQERLLGMDLLRLGLERSTTAREALDVIAKLLETHGQGGPCSDTDTSFTYHNSFLIADPTEAWVLETAGHLWAAQNFKTGHHNISNVLSIGTKIDAMSDGLMEHAIKNGYWSPDDGDFDFAKAYSSGGDSCRLNAGKKLLSNLSSSTDSFSVSDMFTVLRDKKSGICRDVSDGFPSSGSQVSVLSVPGSSRPSSHWFTGTPDPSLSVFKPFLFCPEAKISPHIQAPVFSADTDPVKIKPRFQSRVDRQHRLYKLHAAAVAKMTDGSATGDALLKLMQSLEARCVEDTESFLEAFGPGSAAEAADLFKDLVESEMKFYKTSFGRNESALKCILK